MLKRNFGRLFISLAWAMLFLSIQGPNNLWTVLVLIPSSVPYPLWILYVFLSKKEFRIFCGFVDFLKCQIDSSVKKEIECAYWCFSFWYFFFYFFILTRNSIIRIGFAVKFEISKPNHCQCETSILSKMHNAYSKQAIFNSLFDDTYTKCQPNIYTQIQSKKVPSMKISRWICYYGRIQQMYCRWHDTHQSRSLILTIRSKKCVLHSIELYHIC